MVTNFAENVRNHLKKSALKELLFCLYLLEVELPNNPVLCPCPKPPKINKHRQSLLAHIQALNRHGSLKLTLAYYHTLMSPWP